MSAPEHFSLISWPWHVSRLGLNYPPGGAVLARLPGHATAAITTADISAEQAGKVAAVLDATADLQAGAPLPLLWHWALFSPVAPTASLGNDGHPR